MAQIILDENQHNAVTHTEGPLLVLAGAGSGKTRVLTHRIAEILQKKRARPEQILALTFTNKAAKEMRKRIGETVGNAAANIMTICTFHSLGVRILREFGQYMGLKGNFKILSENERTSLVKNAMRSCGKTMAKQNPREFVSAISLAKNNNIQAHTYEDINPEDRKTARVYKNYAKLQKKEQAVDFDDLLLLPLKLFREHPKTLQAVREKYRYISIDEFQDTNEVQMKLARLLAENHQNIMAVGDDDQGIYSWRGAKITNILRFPHIYEGCRTIILNTNYRSTEHIVRGAMGVVEKNNQRKSKEIVSHAGKGDAIVTYMADDEADEVAWVLDRVSDFEKDGQYTYNQQALLFRTNAHMRRFEEELRIRRMPYHIYGGTSFFDRKEVRDIMAYLNFLNNQDDELSLSRVLKVPDSGINSATLRHAEDLCVERNCSLWESFTRYQDISGIYETQRQKIRTFVEFITPYIRRAQKEENLHNLLEDLLSDLHYRESIQKIYAKEKSLQPRLDNVAEMVRALEQYVYRARQKNKEISLAEFLQNFNIIKGQENDEGKGLTLMTLHKSKGLEFPVVYMVILDDAVMPSPKALEGGGLEEERRLFYVGMTRAMEKLFLTYPKSKIVRNTAVKVQECRFLHEIPVECLDAPPGEKQEEEFKEFSQNFFKEMQEKFQ
ncbi:MAG: ATP-dependent helicase [Fibrobacterota bacterium]